MFLASWGILGSSWGHPWGSGGDLGVILGDLQRFWRVLKGSCVGLGGILGQFAWILGYLGVILGDLGQILGHFGNILALSLV